MNKILGVALEPSNNEPGHEISYVDDGVGVHCNVLMGLNWLHLDAKTGVYVCKYCKETLYLIYDVRLVTKEEYANRTESN